MMLSDEMPFVSRDLVDYLKQMYVPDYFLRNKDVHNNDERIGMMRGVSEVLDVLQNLADRRD